MYCPANLPRYSVDCQQRANDGRLSAHIFLEKKNIFTINMVAPGCYVITYSTLYLRQVKIKLKNPQNLRLGAFALHTIFDFYQRAFVNFWKLEAILPLGTAFAHF
jgi:hypothetical protein